MVLSNVFVTKKNITESDHCEIIIFYHAECNIYIYIYSVTNVPSLISVALETGEEHLPELVTGWLVTPAAHYGRAT